MSIVIVSDTSSDLGGAKSKALGVDLVPTRVVFDGQIFRDGVDLDRVAFYTKLHSAGKKVPTTDPATSDDFAATFARHVAAGNTVVCPTVSADISKTFENARAAAKSFGDKVCVIDSRTVSGGLLLQARFAAEAARAGRPLDDILGLLERMRQHQYATFTPPDLSYIGRSARLSRFSLAVGSLLNVNPVLRVRDGRMEPVSRVFGIEKAHEALIDIVVKNVTDPASTHMLVGHAHAAHIGDAILKRILGKLPEAPASMTLFELGPSVAVHSGPRTIAVFSART